MTRREKILERLENYLSGISTSNGYLTNIGQYVKSNDTQTKPNETVYDVDIKDIVNEHTLGHVETLNVKINLSYTGANAYTMINKMILDIHKCLLNNERALGTAVNENGLRILPNQEPIELTGEKDKKKAFATCDVQIQHRFSVKWNPDLTNYT